MNILISFIKAIAVFDLLVIAVYFGGDILTTVMGRFRKKTVQDDPFDFSVTDAVTVPLSRREGHFPSSFFIPRPPLLWLRELSFRPALCGTLPARNVTLAPGKEE